MASTVTAQETPRFAIDPYPSTYQPIAAAPVLIQGATVLTGDGERLEQGDVLLQDGRIAAVGHGLAVPAGAVIVDGRGKWITPGVIEVHSHLGVYPAPLVPAHYDGNEIVNNAVTGHVWAEHSVWPQDPGFAAALAGGVTTLQILPGSANIISGRGVTLRNVAANTVQAMKFPGAPQSLKMACGENPKVIHTPRTGPSTRMGIIAGYRAAFIEATEYLNRHQIDAAPRRPGAAPADPGRQDLRLDTLAAAINGDILVHIHCFRAADIAFLLDLAKEFNFEIAAIHHAVEAYKVADELAERNICAALWADWWGYKMEAFDGIQENIAIVDRARNGCAIVHTDSSEGIQRLNQEATKVIANAALAGIDIPPERAIRWLTRNPALSMGILDQTGTLDVGKRADVVLWNGNPFSVYALAEQVWIDGALLYDRNNPQLQPVSDFMLGLDASTGGAQ